MKEIKEYNDKKEELRKSSIKSKGLRFNAIEKQSEKYRTDKDYREKMIKTAKKSFIKIKKKNNVKCDECGCLINKGGTTGLCIHCYNKLNPIGSK